MEKIISIAGQCGLFGIRSVIGWKLSFSLLAFVCLCGGFHCVRLFFLGKPLFSAGYPVKQGRSAGLRRGTTVFGWFS